MTLYFKVQALVILSIVIAWYCDKSWSEDENPKKWTDYNNNRIDEILKRKLNGNVAENMIFFLGDGMGITSVTVRQFSC
jgi:hypothetical protein